MMIEVTQHKSGEVFLVEVGRRDGGGIEATSVCPRLNMSCERRRRRRKEMELAAWTKVPAGLKADIALVQQL
jgi:hypothetical protein